MKKIISFALAGLAALSLMSCGLHDATAFDLSAGGLPGAMNGWDNKTAWTEVDENTYTYDFVATDTTQEWKVIAQTGDWNSGAWGGETKEASVPADGKEVTLIYDNKSGGGKNCKSEGLSKGASYKITITVDVTTVKAKLEKTGDAGAPSPYYFDGLYLVGSVFGINGGETAWGFTADNLICGASLDSQTGVLTYTKDIVATAESGEMGINDSAWENKVAVKGTEVKADGVAVVVTGEGDKGNFNVSGLTAGNPYRVTITTTPEKEVSVSIAEICSYILTFKITGLEEGMKAWVNGNCWGSTWPNGWALADWNQAPGNGLTVADAAVADENGVATFGAKWNVSGVAKPGETLSFELKFIASDDDWKTTKYNNANIAFDVEDIAAGTYLVSINAEENEATVTKQ